MQKMAGPRQQDTPAGSWGFESGDQIYPGRHALKFLGGGRRYEAYLAVDDELLTTVVVKILRPERVSDEGALDGLRGEYRCLVALNHPVIVRGFDAVLDGERPHIVLEFLEGPRLSSLIRKYGSLPLEQFGPLALELCAGLHYMHRRAMVHLDVKPRNIIMGAPPRLIDLSIARSVQDAAGLDAAVGTDAYMAPEQCSPAPGSVGPAADVWGLGVTLYQAISGELPFFRTPEEPRPQVYDDPVPLPENVPAPIARVIEPCLERDPSNRPTPRELTEAIEPLIEALPRRPVLGRLRPGLR